MQRVVVIGYLRDGPEAEAEARKLVEAGPPFDLGESGFDRHSVFVANGLVVFLFEGRDLEGHLVKLVNDPVRAAGFGAWASVLVGSPRVARETFYWSREEKTMKKIVIAIDGSPAALEAVEFGLELAAEQGAEPVFVHAAPATEALPVGAYGMGAPVSVPHEPDEHDRSSLDQAVAIAAEKGLEAKAELLVGNAAHAIVAYADSIDADLIVVGSRGHGTVAGALLGSVSRSVLKEATRPVLVVRTAANRVEAALA